MFEIVDRQDLTPNTYLLEVSHLALARAAQPGQFVIVMSHARGERVPLTIADFDRERGTVTLVIQAVGKTTLQMQRDCQVGGRIYSLVGPMGHPSKIQPHKRVVCVGGGLGVAPVFPILRAYKESGATVQAVIGFRSGDLAFWQDRFKRFSDELLLCTDDGSAGLHGPVTIGLKALIERGDADPVNEVVAIGPPRMMKACAELTRAAGIKTTVSLNPIMVDGTGMCGGCRVRVGGKLRFGCVDGPEFDGHQVDFDDLLNRLRRFEQDEQLALRRYRDPEHACHMQAQADQLKTEQVAR